MRGSWYSYSSSVELLPWPELYLFIFFVKEDERKKMTLTRGEGHLVGAQVLVSPSIALLVMVHKAGNTAFFLSDLLAEGICLLESKTKTQKI